MVYRIILGDPYGTVPFVFSRQPLQPMKTKMLISLLAISILAGTGFANSVENSGQTELDVEAISKKTNALVAQYTKLDIFSGVVLIALDGKPFYHKAFGMANRETQTPNTTDTRFIIGSMNKTFTEILILKLVQEGKIKLSDKMVQYLSGFKQREADQITISQLLNHRSGFGDYYNPAFWDMDYKDKNISGITELIKTLPLHFKPGTENEYSNAGYILLGSIIEKVTGKSYADNVEQFITGPLALNQTVLHDVKNIPNRAIGYLKGIDDVEDNEFFITEPRSDGGFYSTALDVMKFYLAFFYNQELLPESLRKQSELLQNLKPYYSQKREGVTFAGGLNGANSVHIELLSEGISIVVLANMDEPIAEHVANGILAIINGKEPKQAQLPTKLLVYQAYLENGSDYIRQHFEQLSENFHPADPKDLILNSLGYDLMMSGHLNEALDLFKLNTEIFPGVANCWDSYGEALRASGDKAGSLKSYRKALDLIPDLPSSVQAVKELESGQ
jgi:CubicO group peptidase (beta-lactamase class C family)